MATNNRVGDMNGKYAFLFKLNMVLIPIFCSGMLTWGVWVTANIYDFKGFMNYGERYSLQDAHKMHDALILYVDENFERKAPD